MDSEGWKKVYQANSNHRKAGVIIVIAYKTDLKSIVEDTEGHFIRINSSGR